MTTSTVLFSAGAVLLFAWLIGKLLAFNDTTPNRRKRNDANNPHRRRSDSGESVR